MPTDHWIISRQWFLKLCPFCLIKNKNGKTHAACRRAYQQLWLDRRTAQLRKERDAWEQKNLEQIYKELGDWFPSDNDLKEMEREYDNRDNKS